MKLKFYCTFLLAGCVGQGDVLHLRGFNEEQALAITAAAAPWHAVGADLEVVVGGDGDVIEPADLTEFDDYGRTEITGNRAAVLGTTSRHAHVWIDFKVLGDQRILRLITEHEFGHVLGLGPPSDARQHIIAHGDVMCGDTGCLLEGDGVLSEADVAAYRAR